MRLAAAAFLAVLLAGSSLASAQSTTTTPAPAATPAPATTTTPPASTAGKHHHREKTPTTEMPAASSADEASAKQKCGSDTLVWSNPSSKAYHTAESRYFGKTKKGSFMCMKDAQAAGFHAVKAAHGKKAAASNT